MGTASRGGSIFDIPFLFTLKGLFTRPGHAIREFLEGKRLQHAEIYSLLIIFLITDNLIQYYSGFQFQDLYQRGDDVVASLADLRRTNPKLFLLATIPVQALFSYFIFTGSKLNYIEHLYLNAYRNVGQLLISIVFSSITLFTADHSTLIGINSFLLTE